MESNLNVSHQILSSLSKRLKLDVSKIQPQHSLRYDLGLDSADSIELVFALEEMFDLEVSDQDFRKLTTVSEVIAYVEGRLSTA
ncbi:MAG TPA: phosphopantetheine-binding protein [Nitrospira sp.]|nr:phosphopantetheine-binding protein [Nitrospira sp.]